MDKPSGATVALQDRILKAERIAWRELQWLQSTSLKEEVDVSKLVTSLRENGMIRGFHVWEDPEGQIWIIDGHHMKKAISMLEPEMEIPDLLTCYFVDCKDRQEAAKFIVLHSSAYAQMTTTGLLEHLNEFNLDLGELENQVHLEAFDISSLDELAAEAEPMDDSEDEAPTVIPTQPVTQSGDLYELQTLKDGVPLRRHRLHCADSTDKKAIERLMEGLPAPVVMVTDPPYGVEYDPNWRTDARKGKIKATGKVMNDDIADWTEVWQLSPCPVAYVWHAGKYTHIVAESMEKAEYELVSQIIWNKNTGAISRGDYHWKHEPCWYGVRKGQRHNWQGARDQWTVWDIQTLSSKSVSDAEGQSGHGTQKPLECMRRPMVNNAAKGDAVFDPFLGSGSSLIAAEQTGRQCLGQELDPAYADVIVRRFIEYMMKAQRNFSILKNGEEISAEDYLLYINPK